jgi:hypothetical protein
MNMFRHHHVADQQELIARPHLVENLQERISFPGSAQQCTALITTTSDEMQMALPVTTLEAILILQGELNPTRTLCKKRKECGTLNFNCKDQTKSLRG